MEVVVVKAEHIPALQDVLKNSLSLYAFHDQQLRAIPWQLDQVDEQGLIRLDHENGKEAVLPERISPHDELLWMAADMGSRAPAALWYSAFRFPVSSSDRKASCAAFKSPKTKAVFAQSK